MKKHYIPFSYKWLKAIFFFIAGTGFISPLSGQNMEINTYEKPKYDTSYIQSFRENLVLGLLLPQKYIDFSINDIKNKLPLRYEPNTNGAIGVKCSYKWLGMALSIGLPESKELTEKYGKTQRVDLQVNTYLRKFVIDGYFQWYNGFYLENMQSYFDEFEDELSNYYTRPDLTLLNAGVSGRYIWNNQKFSYKAAYDFNEKQKKRAGSLIIGGYAFINAMSADSTVVPGFARDNFHQDSYFTALSAINLGISVGYIYTLVIKKNFYITLGFVPGIGLQSVYATNTNDEILVEKGGIGITTSTRISMGYSKRRFYAAISGVSGNNNLNNQDKTAISFGYGNVKLLAGYRFSLNKNKKKP